MKLVNDILDSVKVEGVSCKAEAEAFSNLLKEHGIDDVNVDILKDGSDYIVCLEDEEDKEVLVFGVDEEENAYCLSTSGIEDPLGNEVDVTDFQTAEPSLAEDGSLDMTDLKWMNKSILQTLFSESVEEGSEADEKFKLVVRGGKKQKVAVKIRKKILNSKQKAALIKARRKAHTGTALRKRAISNKIRKRIGLK